MGEATVYNGYRENRAILAKEICAEAERKRGHEVERRNKKRDQKSKSEGRKRERERERKRGWVEFLTPLRTRRLSRTLGASWEFACQRSISHSLTHHLLSLS